MLRFSITTRRAAAAALLGILAAPVFGATSSAAGSAPVPAPMVEAACPAPTPGTAQCLALRLVNTATPATAVSPQTMPSGYGPADLQSAYALPSATAGTGMTVAIVDAYDLPTAEADLGAYRTQFGLPPCTIATGCFNKVDQNGGTSYPTTPDSQIGWETEIALDIDMVSAICPNCHILLVEANTNDYADLGTAENTAASWSGVVAVSNSYAGAEGGNETSLDAYYKHPGLAITASTGDCGYDCAGDRKGIGYPAASPYVIAVGGTRLIHDSSTRGWSESAWGDASNTNGAGSGCSLFEPKPTWQHDTGCTRRTEADVSAVADPSTGVAEYEGGSWFVEGGTSASSPIIAATYALAGTPAAGTYPASYLYGHPANLYDAVGGNNDVTEHSCTVTYLCNAVAGYDGPTGLGTPNGIAAFSMTAPGKPTHVAARVDDKKADLTWTAPPNGGSTISGYKVTETEQALGVLACAMTGPSSCTVSGLTNGTEYAFTIHASNVVGDGPESDPSNHVTPLPPTVPGPPTGVAATGGITSARVSWSAPADDGRSPITSYTVTSTPGDKHCTATTALSCTVLGLAGGELYSFNVRARNAVGMGPASAQTGKVMTLAGATYVPIAPVRSLDTRAGIGMSDFLTANTPRCFGVAGRNSIPAGAVAVTGNVTVVNATHSWAIYLGPAPIVSPKIATLNFAAGQVVGTSLTVALSSTGSVCATYTSTPGNTTDLVFDVTGYFVPNVTGETYHPRPPARVLDTRTGVGLSGKLAANTPRTFAVWGHGGIPVTARAVTGNVTVVNSTNAWAVYLGPAPIAKPTTSTINFTKGQIQGNGLTVALSSTGTLSATFMSSAGNTTDLVFDITGYYTADMSGDKFVPLTPTRLLDTRTAGAAGKLTANTPRTFPVQGHAGVSVTATGITGNATVVGPTNAWALYVGSVAVSKPTTSTVNFTTGQAKSNGLTVALSAGGTLSATYMSSPGNKTDLLVDVTGYFVP